MATEESSSAASSSCLCTSKYFAFLIIGLLAYLIFQYKLSRYHRVFISFCTVGVFSGLLLVPLFIFRPRNPNNFRLPLPILRWFLRRIKVTVELINGHYLKKHESFVIVCNHQSAIDVLVANTFWPDRCTVLMKKELLYQTGPFGLASWLAGAVFIDRGNREKSHSTIDNVTKSIVQKKLKFLIFPEGTRTCSPHLLPFKMGAFHMAVGAQIPIIPVVISSYLTFMDPKTKRFDPGSVRVEVLPPVLTTGLTSQDVHSLSDTIRQDMVRVFEATVPQDKSQ